MTPRMSARILAALALGALVACGDGKDGPAAGGGTGGSGSATGAALPESVYAAAEPAGAKAVKAVRDGGGAGEEVVVFGRIKDFVSGLAAFTLVDVEIKACDVMEMPDECKTPWDYCCVDPAELAKNAVTIEFRSGDLPVRAPVRGFHGIDRLSYVVVTGRVERDEAGNVTVVARSIHRRA